jgi:hypothetical protein
LTADRIYNVQVGQRRHKVSIRRDGDRFRAESQTVKGLSADGDTLEEALDRIRDVLVEWARTTGPRRAKPRRKKVNDS